MLKKVPRCLNTIEQSLAVDGYIERPAQDLSSPNCLAIDRPIARNVNLSYRFKRDDESDAGRGEEKAMSKGRS